MYLLYLIIKLRKSVVFLVRSKKIQIEIVEQYF